MNKDNKHLIQVAKILMYMIGYITATIKERSEPGIHAEVAAESLERFIKETIDD